MSDFAMDIDSHGVEADQEWERVVDGYHESLRVQEIVPCAIAGSRSGFRVIAHARIEYLSGPRAHTAAQIACSYLKTEFLQRRVEVQA